MGARSTEECITHGPWGGSKGKKWMYMPKGFVKKIIVAHGGVIDSLKFHSYCSTGETQSSFFGGKGGNRTDTICIDYPEEYLILLRGTVGSYDGFDIVMSICFVRNKHRYGPYGTNSGIPFSYDGKGGVIVGFHGKVGSTRARMAMSRDAGPWGSSGGSAWDDGVFANIRQVLVHVGESLNVIYSVKFGYVQRDGKLIWSNSHGADGGKQELDEYLIGISGFYGAVEGYNGMEAITSISFRTNKTVHGPYGQANGVGYIPFSSTASPGRVVGFRGTNSGFLRAIGIHMEYF